jgi:hypothetical protein
MAGSMKDMELPAPGFPASEQDLSDWFRTKHGREPSERELGALMAAMAQREATPPHNGARVDLDG